MDEIPLEYDYGPGEQCGEESPHGESGPCIKAEGHPDSIHEDARGHRFYA